MTYRFTCHSCGKVGRYSTHDAVRYTEDRTVHGRELTVVIHAWDCPACGAEVTGEQYRRKAEASKRGDR